MPANNCTECRHYEWDYEDSDGHTVGSWCACRARDKVSNLKQFPFRRTNCPKFEKPTTNNGEDPQ